jgi:hypothetical protein
MDRPAGTNGELLGDPGVIRTRGPQIRNLVLYPAELRGPEFSDHAKQVLQ